MELRHLRYFRAIGREEHFGRAAQQLRVAQPALTRQIRDLETELGVELFERLPRGVRLSAAGRVFLEEVEEILAQVDRAADRARRFASGHLGVIRVGVSEIIASHDFVARGLMSFRESEPQVVLELRSLGSVGQIAALKDGQIDAGILYDAHIDERDRPLLESVPMGRGEVMLAVPRNHSLGQRSDIAVADLADEPLLWPERRSQPAYHDSLMRACVAAGLTPNIVQECTTNSILLSLVSAGMGAGLVTTNRTLRDGTERDGAVRWLPIRDLALAFDVLLVWRKRDQSAALHRFVDAMKGEATR